MGTPCQVFAIMRPFGANSSRQVKTSSVQASAGGVLPFGQVGAFAGFHDEPAQLVAVQLMTAVLTLASAEIWHLTRQRSRP
jgi:hypothetical protein